MGDILQGETYIAPEVLHITFMRYISKVGIAVDCICDPVMVHIVSFPLVSTLKLHTKSQNPGTLSACEWDTVLQQETSIAAEVFHHLP